MEYTMEEAAKAVGKERINLVMWERRGLIPSPDRTKRPMTFSAEEVRQIKLFSMLMDSGVAGENAARLAEELIDWEGKVFISLDGWYIGELRADVEIPVSVALLINLDEV